MTGHFVGRNHPEGLLADAIFDKGQFSPPQLLDTVRNLLAQSPVRASHARPTRPRFGYPVTANTMLSPAPNACGRSPFPWMSRAMLPARPRAFTAAARSDSFWIRRTEIAYRVTVRCAEHTPVWSDGMANQKLSSRSSGSGDVVGMALRHQLV
jgi:hypothetical protein